MTYEELTEGFDQTQLYAVYASTADQIPYHGEFKVGASSIHGLGVFVLRQTKPGDEIGPARLGSKRTPIGRYTNHAHAPNAKMVRKGSDLYVVALSPIEPNEEVTVDYAQVLRVNHEAPTEWR
jgi:hypothetical protein